MTQRTRNIVFYKYCFGRNNSQSLNIRKLTFVSDMKLFGILLMRNFINISYCIKLNKIMNVLVKYKF